jgi:hypothetical protein
MRIGDDDDERKRNKTESIMMCRIVNITRMPERGIGRGSIDLLHRRHMTF